MCKLPKEDSGKLITKKVNETNVFIYPIHNVITNGVNCDGRCIIANTKCKHLTRIKLKPYPQIICIRDYNKPIDTQNKPTDEK